MRIALLNLPFDNNYGGNLQRYALIKVLQGMGHEVEHINLQRRYRLPWYKWPYSIPKRMIKRYLLGRKNVEILMERKQKREDASQQALCSQFYERYIPHTEACFNIQQVRKITEGRYDAYIVGSDQVWRKGSAGQIGLANYLLRFTKGQHVKRMAYAVSFGIAGNVLSQKEISSMKEDYSRFDAVSVREDSALELLDSYGWNNPKAELCLDPTLLLTADDYAQLAKEGGAQDITSGKIFCYILDETEKTRFVTDFYRKHMKKEIVKVGLDNTAEVSIAQWLNNIRCADLVITDSFHGCVFSIIFNKPFVFLGNKGRGNARLESLFKLLQLAADDTEHIDYKRLDERIEELRGKSLAFIRQMKIE